MFIQHIKEEWKCNQYWIYQNTDLEVKSWITKFRIKHWTNYILREENIQTKKIHLTLICIYDVTWITQLSASTVTLTRRLNMPLTKVVVTYANTYFHAWRCWNIKGVQNSLTMEMLKKSSLINTELFQYTEWHKHNNGIVAVIYSLRRKGIPISTDRILLK